MHGSRLVWVRMWVLVWVLVWVLETGTSKGVWNISTIG